MKWPQLKSLQVRITLLVLLALTPAIILHVVSAMEKRAMALTTAAGNLRIVTELAALNIGKLLQSSGEALSGLVLLPEIRSMQPEAAHALLAKAKGIFPDFSSITLLDLRGNVVASTLPDTSATNYADRPWVRAATAGSPLGIGAFAQGRRSGLPGIALASPVRGDSGDVVGVCTVAVRLSEVISVIANAHMPRQSLATLFDDTGLVLANWPENTQEIGQPLPDAIQILAGQESAPQATVTGPGPDGSPYFFSVADVRFGDSPPLHLRVGEPKALAEGPMAASLFQDMVIFALALALALFAAHLFGRTFLLLPAGKLARMAKAMAVGDLDRRCDMGGGHGELSELGAALDAMADTLRERIRFTQEIIDAIPTPLFYKDLDGRIVGVNKTYETDLRPLAAVKGKTSCEIDAPEMAARCEATDKDVLDSPSRTVQFESTLRLKDGLAHDFLIFKSVYYSASGAPAGIVGVCLDITTRNQSEKALAASEMRYRSLLTSMRDGFVVIDSKDHIVETNPAFREMLGYTKAELAGITYKDITPAKWHAQEAAILRDAVDAHGFSPIFEKEYRRKDGSLLSVAIRVHRYPGAPEDERRYFAVARDVTATKAIEADLRLAKEEAERANRAKSDFLAKMSHDIRTPLNAVIGMTDLTLGSELSPSQRDALETARESAGILLDLINDILDISKIEARKLELANEPFDLRRTLAATVRAMRPQAARKGLALRLSVAPDVPRFVRGDQIRLRQILVNLIGNAVKFTESGGVSVSLARVAAAQENSTLLSCVVADTGVGIPPERLGRIFDMFTQADATVSRRYGGTGLGLAICRELTRLMGGNITAESAPGRGSAFRFALPLPEAQPEEHGAELPAATGFILPADRPLRILLAEDNPVNVKVAAAYLSRRGHTFVVAQNGKEALDLLACHPFDVILMDLEMPECDGFEATRRLRAGEAGPMNRSRPVIAMTAHALSGVRQRCLEAGMTDYLAKPLDFQALGVLLGGITDAAEPKPAPATQDDAKAPDLDTAAALQRLGGDTELLQELESDFLRQYPRKLRHITLCRNRENWDEAALAAHSLKNIVGAIGAEAARRLAGDLEESLRHSDSDAADRLFGAIKDSLHRAAETLGNRATAQSPGKAVL